MATKRPPKLPTMDADLMNQLLTQMQQTASMVTQLQAEMDGMRKGGPAPSGSQVPAAPALTKALDLVGPASKTRQTGKPKLVSPTAVEDLEQDDEDDVAAAEEQPLDQLLKAALLTVLDPSSKQKKKQRGPGLPLDATGSDSDEEGQDPLRRLSGAKGPMLLEKLRLAMDSDPKAYITAMENLAAQSLGEPRAGPMTLEKFARDMLPLGSERTLGYVTWGVVRALTMLKAGEVDKAHLILLLLVASIEQYKLDGSWGAAWRLTHLTPPPFAEWKSKEGMIGQLRQDHARSRLVHGTWAAARGQVEGRRGPHSSSRRPEPERPDKPPKGRGRGKGGQEAPEK